REIPFSTTTESLIGSIEQAAQKKKIKVATIDDRTAEEVEIVLHLPRGVYADEVEPQLYAYTQCEVQVNSNIVVIQGDRPAELTVPQLLEALTGRLREQIKAELELELGELEDQQHWLTLEQIFIENRVYKRIETAKTSKAVREEVWEGMKAYEEFFIRPMTDDDVERLLKIPIRRISLYDIEKFRRQVDDIVRQIKKVRGQLRRLTQTTVEYLSGLLEKFGPQYPRRTEVTSFDVVSKAEVARQTIKLAYDTETGFFGSDVKGDKFEMTVSEYDKILIVTGDAYRIVTPPEKLLVGKKPLAIMPFDQDNGVHLTYLYRDLDKCAWAKKIHITGFIHDKEYDLIKDRAGKVDRLWVGEPDHRIYMKFAPAKRQRKIEDWYELEGLTVCGLGARGSRMSSKPVSLVRLDKSKPRVE
ncbi:MAG: DNA gyrase subunit A, partial [Planctomycetota bacterium]